MCYAGLIRQYSIKSKLCSVGLSYHYFAIMEIMHVAYMIIHYISSLHFQMSNSIQSLKFMNPQCRNFKPHTQALDPRTADSTNKSNVCNTKASGQK